MRKSAQQKTLRRFNPIRSPEIFRHLILAWLITAFFNYTSLNYELCDLSKLDGIAQMSLGGTLLGTAVIFCVLFALARVSDTAKYEKAGIFAAFAALAAVSLYYSHSPAFLAACAIIVLLLLGYLIKGADTSSPEYDPVRSHKAFLIVCAVVTLMFFLFVSAWTVCRVMSFSAPTFDFGIFAQMFHNMKESGIPMTTVERDGQLSHFAVHVSPAYYLLLPIYILCPRPETLQVLQAAVLASSVIPLWLIGKNRGLSGLSRTLLCVVLLAFPALAGGTGYDIHENCMLTPFILWTIYGVERKSIPLILVFAALTLTVKEDAAVYVAVIALYVIIASLVCGVKKEKKMLITGAAVLAVSLLWFFAVTSYLANSGDGVMTYRYKNFMYDGSSSLVTVIKAVIMCPMKALFECVDKEKLSYVGLTLIPLLGLPLFSRRYERFILLIPYLLINLMSDYQYQHDIFFQYSFGSGAFLIYLTVVNLADIKNKKLRLGALGAACAVAISMFALTVVPKALPYIERCAEKGEYYESIRGVLDIIPDGASAAATTYYTVYLSDREVLYDIKHSSKEHVLECEYVAIAHNSESSFKKYEKDGVSGYDAFLGVLDENGYRPVGELEKVLTVYKRER